MATLNSNKQKQYKNRRLFKLRRKLATFRYNFIAGIPGTSSFKFRISRDIVRSVKAAMGTFDKIQTIPPERKSLYSKMIKTYEISLSKIEFIIRNFAHFILNILLLFSLILSFIILFITIKLFSFKLLVFVFIDSSKLEPLINEFMMPFASITFVLFFSLCVNTLVLHIFIKIFKIITSFNKRLATAFIFGWPIIILLFSSIVVYQIYSNNAVKFYIYLQFIVLFLQSFIIFCFSIYISFIMILVSIEITATSEIGSHC